MRMVVKLPIIPMLTCRRKSGTKPRNSRQRVLSSAIDSLGVQYLQFGENLVTAMASYFQVGSE